MNKLHENKNRIYKYSIMLVVVTFVLMLASQFGALALLGTKGTEVSSIRSQKEQIREEITRMQAEIDEAKTLAQINSGISVVYQSGSHKAQPVQILAQEENPQLSIANE